MLRMCHDSARRNKALPTPAVSHLMAGWIAHQRRARNGGELTRDRARAMDTYLPGWRATPGMDPAERMAALDTIERAQRAASTTDLPWTISEGTWSRVYTVWAATVTDPAWWEWQGALDGWIDDQCDALLYGRLDHSRAERLNRADPTWRGTADVLFADRLARYQDHIATERRVPTRVQGPQEKELAHFMAGLRRAADGKGWLPPDWQQVLDRQLPGWTEPLWRDKAPRMVPAATAHTWA